MKVINGYVSVGLVGCRKEFKFEVEDDTSDDDIEELARDEMFNCIEWGWKHAPAELKREQGEK